MDISYNPPFDPSISENTINSRDVLTILRRHLWIILLLTAVSVAVAAFISSRTPKAWSAQAQLILVQKPAPLVVVTGASGSGGGASGSGMESVDTQVALVKNIAMANRAIEWLEGQVRRGNVPGEMLLGLTPRGLQGSIDAVALPDTNLFQISVVADDPQKAKILANAVCQAFMLWKQELATKNARETLGTLSNRSDQARKQMAAAEQAELAFKHKVGMVDVNIQQSGILEESMRRQAEIKNLSQELQVERQNLASLQEALKQANAAIRHGVNVRDDALVLDLQRQVSGLQIALANSKTRYLPDYPGPEGPTLIRKQLDEVKRRLATALQGTLNNTASLEVQKGLSASYNQAQIELKSTQAKLAAATGAYNGLKKQLNAIPENSLQYTRLTRNADLARQLYTSLQSGLNASRLDQYAANGNIGIAYPASLPEKPIRPDRKRDLLFGAAVGLVLSLGCIFLLEQGDRRVRSVEDMRRLVPGPIVGTIPQLSRGEMRSLTSGGLSPRAAEAYSMIWGNLALMTRNPLSGMAGVSALSAASENETPRGSGGQLMLITSSLPGEGKSFTAAQLARNIARSGKRVILVDADLRRPTQNLQFRTNETTGMANVLSGELSLREALVHSDVKNLLLLHSGTSPRNPTELISSGGMPVLLSSLRDEADVIIIDAPASAVVADALFIAPYIDVIIHVVGAGQVESSLVRDTTAALSAAAPKIITFLMNRAPVNSTSAYKYYQSYTPWNGSSGIKAVAAKTAPARPVVKAAKSENEVL